MFIFFNVRLLIAKRLAPWQLGQAPAADKQVQKTTWHDITNCFIDTETITYKYLIYLFVAFHFLAIEGIDNNLNTLSALNTPHSNNVTTVETSKY